MAGLISWSLVMPWLTFFDVEDSKGDSAGHFFPTAVKLGVVSKRFISVIGVVGVTVVEVLELVEGAMREIGSRSRGPGRA
jgi:hypothetical protein